MPTHIGSGKAIISLGAIPIAKARAGNELVYPAGAAVTYHVDTNAVYTEEVDSGESCILPKTFTPAKEGWEFIGWRLDSVASKDVLDSLLMDDDPIILYAVFRQDVILSYDGNGSTEGEMDAETQQRYYNNGEVNNPTFTVKACGFSLPVYSFVQWRLNGINGDTYNPMDDLTLSENATLYAEWTYVGNPITLLDENGTSYINVKWTVNRASNLSDKKIGDVIDWSEGKPIKNAYGVYLRAGIANTSNPSELGFKSSSISTKGNRTLTITTEKELGPAASITVNNVTKYFQSAQSSGNSRISTNTFDISDVSSFTIDVRWQLYGYQGSGININFVSIELS